MSRDTELDKRSSEELGPPPRMLGDTEVAIIMDYAARLPAGAGILEVGPWLGGVTRLLAQHGNMTVVDRFIWTDANAKNYPGISAPEENFRSIFEAHMAAEGITARIIEATLPELAWPGGPLDFVLIDAPRTAEQLHGCMSAIAPVLKPGAYVIAKHALNRRDLGLGSYIDALIGLGFLRMVATRQPNWCNIVVLEATDRIAALAELEDPENVISTAPMTEDFTDPWYGRSLSVFRLAYLAQKGRWADAYARLSEIPPSSEILNLWDEMEPLLHLPGNLEADGNNGVLSELMWVHNDSSVAARVPIQIGLSVAARLRAYWRNNAATEWVNARLDAKLLCYQSADDILARLAPATAQLFHRDVVEVGHNLEGGTLAALLAGARSYVGIELSMITDLAAQLREKYSNIDVTQDTEAALKALKKAEVLIIGAELDGRSVLAKAVADRAKASKNFVTVIQLS
jgi:predicted O-methyltransferase YrrM